MSNVVKGLFNRNRESTISEPCYPESVRCVQATLESYSTLEKNWDSYGALKPSTKALMGAIQLATHTFQENTPTPDVFPVPNGNIQIEWSIHQFDIEIEIESGSLCYVSYEDHRTNQIVWDHKKFTLHLAPLTELIEQLTNRHMESRSGRTACVA